MSGREERFGQPGEAQFYDDLSLFIRLFKKIVTGVEQLAGLVQSQEDCSDHLRELKCILSEQEDLVDQYSYPLSSQSPHRNTYFRFVCRLLETLSPLRNRTQTKEDADLFAEFGNKVEMSIGSLKGEANIGKMFRKIFALTLKLCLSCELLLTSGSAQLAVDMLQRRSLDEKAQSEPRNLMMARTAHNSESIFQKAMSDVNCRFSSLSCLDIDYNFFKADYFLARSQKEELTTTFLDRNSMILKTIANYSRRFQEYLKRK